ncbi:MAG: Arm DNA-binding domain-containing protein, partial [Bacteroidota bacterium]|nr:Arm DNA-binding domain-containing protein [Bacteroidota bacterium]
MKVHFRVKPSKVGKDGKCPINVEIPLNNKQVILFTGERCNPSEKTWNGRRVMGKEPFKDEINLRLDTLELKLQKIESEASQN